MSFEKLQFWLSLILRSRHVFLVWFQNQFLKLVFYPGFWLGDFPLLSMNFLYFILKMSLCVLNFFFIENRDLALISRDEWTLKRSLKNWLWKSSFSQLHEFILFCFTFVEPWSNIFGNTPLFFRYSDRGDFLEIDAFCSICEHICKKAF